MLRVSEEGGGSRKRESYVESYRQLGRTLLDLQHAADHIFDAISQRVAEERGKLTEISQRIQSAKTRIDELAHSEHPLTIKSPSRYPSSSIQEEDFRPLFSNHDKDADEGSSVTNLFVNGGLNREFGADGTLELFQFFSEENIGYPLTKTQETVKSGHPVRDSYLEKILEAPKCIDDSFLALDSSEPLSTPEAKKKDELPPPPPSLLKNTTSLSDSAGYI